MCSLDFLKLCIFFTIYAKGIFALVCNQCNGWIGDYPLADTVENTCDNRNYHCQTDQFCVKMIDAMSPGVNYATFKSDCNYATNIQVNPTNLTTIIAGTCYPYQDGSAPPKRYYYCYCNDRDYCNSANSIKYIIFVQMIIFLL